MITFANAMIRKPLEMCRNHEREMKRAHDETRENQKHNCQSEGGSNNERVKTEEMRRCV